MQHKLLFVVLAMSFAFASCKKDDTTEPSSSQTFPVTAIIKNALGQPQGGATLTLKNPPSNDPKFSAISDSIGRATIQSPAGQQVLVAKIGSAFLTEIPVTVQANSAGTNVGDIRLQQNTSQARILVVQASAEDLEDVLRVIGFTTFDSTSITALRDSANADSTRLLNYLRQYTLIFTNCHGSSEGGSTYAVLSRTYGRYVQGGGKMYGGHYNYYHLRRIWPPYYTVSNASGNPSTDTLLVVDPTLSLYVGFTLAKWNSIDSRRLSGYEKFSDLPTGAKVYGVINRTTPPVAVIVENYQGTGKYLWTNYHNQDIKDDPVLVKIVQYFLLSL